MDLVFIQILKYNKYIGIFLNDVLVDGYYSIQLEEMVNESYLKVKDSKKEPITILDD